MPNCDPHGSYGLGNYGLPACWGSDDFMGDLKGQYIKIGVRSYADIAGSPGVRGAGILDIYGRSKDTHYPPVPDPNGYEFNCTDISFTWYTNLSIMTQPHLDTCMPDGVSYTDLHYCPDFGPGESQEYFAGLFKAPLTNGVGYWVTPLIGAASCDGLDPPPDLSPIQPILSTQTTSTTTMLFTCSVIVGDDCCNELQGGQPWDNNIAVNDLQFCDTEDRNYIEHGALCKSTAAEGQLYSYSQLYLQFKAHLARTAMASGAVVVAAVAAIVLAIAVRARRAHHYQHDGLLMPNPNPNPDLIDGYE